MYKQNTYNTHKFVYMYVCMHIYIYIKYMYNINIYQKCRQSNCVIGISINIFKYYIVYIIVLYFYTRNS